MGGKCSGEDLIVDTLAIAKQTVTKSSGSSASPAADVTTNFPKENVECLSNVGIAVSSGDDTCMTEKLTASDQLQRASSGDSQLTSSDGSDSKMVAGKTAEQKASSGSLDLPFCFFLTPVSVLEGNMKNASRYYFLSSNIYNGFGLQVFF